MLKTWSLNQNVELLVTFTKLVNVTIFDRATLLNHSLPLSTAIYVNLLSVIDNMGGKICDARGKTFVSDIIFS